MLVFRSVYCIISHQAKNSSGGVGRHLRCDLLLGDRRLLPPPPGRRRDGLLCGAGERRHGAALVREGGLEAKSGELPTGRSAGGSGDLEAEDVG